MSHVSSQSGAYSEQFTEREPLHQKWLSGLVTNGSGYAQEQLQEGSLNNVVQDKPEEGASESTVEQRQRSNSANWLAREEDNGDGRYQHCSSGDEALREELRLAENDHMMLESQMQWKEVQWKTQLETLE